MTLGLTPGPCRHQVLHEWPVYQGFKGSAYPSNCSELEYA